MRTRGPVMHIVLDTHIVLLAAFGKLSSVRLALLEDASNTLYVSEISAWEIAKLHQYERIQLDDGLDGFLEKLFSHPRYTMVGLEPGVLATMLKIGDEMHRDPADQLIVATTLVKKSVLMTNDCDVRKLAMIECI